MKRHHNAMRWVGSAASQGKDRLDETTATSLLHLLAVYVTLSGVALREAHMCSRMACMVRQTNAYTKGCLLSHVEIRTEMNASITCKFKLAAACSAASCVMLPTGQELAYLYNMQRALLQDCPSSNL